MPNPFGAPEIAAHELATSLRDNHDLVWLDVREANEVALVAIEDPRIQHLPLSLLATAQLDALPASVADKETNIVVMCHHGVRSAQVVVWLQQHGWTNVWNLAGGIDEWARVIDPKIGSY